MKPHIHTACSRRLLATGVLVLGWLALHVAAAGVAWSAECRVGAAAVNITPDRPVALNGQMHTRISQGVESPLFACALAIESRDDNGVAGDEAILVACDVALVPEGVIEEVRDSLRGRLNDFDPSKLILSATHTHTAPVLEDGLYEIPSEGVMSPSEYRAYFVERTAGAAQKAWQSRKPGYVGWGMGHAVVAQNRLAVYDDGRAAMYGDTARSGFERFEGYEDHSLDVLFFWDENRRLIATAMNLPCPAQEVEGLSQLSADIWHPIRETLKASHGPDLVVLGWTGAAGDQSPHLMFRKAAEERMRRLRGLDRLQEISRRVVAGWEEAHEGAAKEMHQAPTFRHVVRKLPLPVRQVTREESLEAARQAELLQSDPSKKRVRLWHQEVVERFSRQKPGDVLLSEIHVLRLGDVALATNQFELYTDYGVRMKARSPALQTFIIQLSGPGTYLPTSRGVFGGAYGAIVQSNQVGPEGGRMLVDKTVQEIETLWSTAP